MTSNHRNAFMDINKSFFITIVILLIVFVITILIDRRGIPFVAETNIEKLPMEIMGLKAVEDFFDDAIYEELKADKHVYRHYRSIDGTQMDLYIGYYGTAKGGRTPHNPYACLPGSGWGIVSDTNVKLKKDSTGKYENINYIVSRRGEVFDVVYHWYQSAGDKILSTGIEQNIQRFIGKVFYNRNDGAFVRVSSLTTEDKVNQTKQLVQKFSEEILKLLPDYWPVEQDKN